MSTIRSRITGRPGSGLQHDRLLELAQVGDAGQPVLAVDVHRVRTAHALAATSGGNETESSKSVLMRISASSSILSVACSSHLQLLHVRLGVLVRDRSDRSRSVSVRVPVAVAGDGRWFRKRLFGSHGLSAWVLQKVRAFGLNVSTVSGFMIDRLVRQAVALRVPQRVLHPVGVVAVRIVAVRVRAAALLARLGRDDRALRGLDQVVEFERLDAGRVEHLATCP